MDTHRNTFLEIAICAERWFVRGVDDTGFIAGELIPWESLSSVTSQTKVKSKIGGECCFGNELDCDRFIGMVGMMSIGVGGDGGAAAAAIFLVVIVVVIRSDAIMGSNFHSIAIRIGQDMFPRCGPTTDG